MLHRKDLSWINILTASYLLLLLLAITKVDRVEAVSSWTQLVDGIPGSRELPILGAFYQPPAFSGTTGKRIIVLYGGSKTTGGADLNDLWYYDEAAQTWELKSPSNPPPAMYGACGAVGGPYNAPRLYVFGGSTLMSGSSNVMYYIDLLNPVAWGSIFDPVGSPPGRDQCTMTPFHDSPTDPDTNTLLYLYGGKDQSTFFNTLHSFNTTTQKWKALASTVEGRAGTSMVQIGANTLSLWGGYTTGGVTAQTFLDYQRLNDVWAIGGLLSGPNPSRGHVSSSNLAGTTFLKFGGENAGDRRGELWVYSTIDGTWSMGPSEYTNYNAGIVTTTIATGSANRQVFFVYGGLDPDPLPRFRMFFISLGLACSDCASGVPDPLRNCECICNAGFGGPGCNLTCPVCVNGVSTNCNCSCYEGWTGPTCAVAVCPTFRCTGPPNNGTCVSNTSLCATGVSQNGSLYTEPIVEFQATISTLTTNTISVASATTGAPRITLTIPPNAFFVRDSSGQPSSATTTLLNVRAVSTSYLSTIPFDTNNIFSNLVDLSYTANVENTNATVSLEFTVETRANTFDISQLCLGFIDTTVGRWSCFGTSLTTGTTNSTRRGTTTHFTSFGVLYGGGSNGGGDGGGFDNVLIAPIVLSIFGALVIVLFVLVVGSVAKYLYKKKRNDQMMGRGRGLAEENL